MWYVIRTMTGKEHEVCLWINTYAEKRSFKRCFVPLYENVWRKGGAGNIVIRRLFSGYVFLESDDPGKIYEVLKKIPQYAYFLYMPGQDNQKTFLPIREDEQEFFENVLTDGLLRVSYIHRDKRRQVDRVIGPLERYWDSVEKYDIHHRYAIANIPLAGEMRRIKFGLWTDADSKLGWIEQANAQGAGIVKKKTETDLQPGDMVINTQGLFGDQLLCVKEVIRNRTAIAVEIPLMGELIRMEMDADDVKKVN